MTPLSTNDPLRLLSGWALSLMLIAPGVTARPTPNGESRCADLNGLQRARCERQRELHATCGAIRGEALSHCERCFIAANAIPCEHYDGDDRRQCEVELDAVPTCSDGPVEAFMPCLNKALSAAQPAVTAQR